MHDLLPRVLLGGQDLHQLIHHVSKGQEHASRHIRKVQRIGDADEIHVLYGRRVDGQIVEGLFCRFRRADLFRKVCRRDGGYAGEKGVFCAGV